jgi:hypothetical protein
VKVKGLDLAMIESKVEYGCGWEFSYYTGTYEYVCDGVVVSPGPNPGGPIRPN